MVLLSMPIFWSGIQHTYVGDPKQIQEVSSNVHAVARQ